MLEHFVYPNNMPHFVNVLNSSITPAVGLYFVILSLIIAAVFVG